MVGCVWAGNYETSRKILCISFHKNSKGEIRNWNKVFVLVIEKLVSMRISTNGPQFRSRYQNRKRSAYCSGSVTFFCRLKRFLLIEVLIHHLDTIRLLIGPVQVVAAHTARISPEVIGEDMALIGLKAVNGAIDTITGNFSAGRHMNFLTDCSKLIGSVPAPQLLHQRG